MNNRIACVLLVCSGLVIQSCGPPDSINQNMEKTRSNFPVESIRNVFEYTPGNKRALTAEEVTKWKDMLNDANRVGYRRVPNSEKRALRATFVFLGENGNELLKLDEWEDGNISSGNDFFSWE